MIRVFQHGDHVAIAEIFTASVHQIACEAYTPEQCQAWSDKAPNPEHWRKRCELKRPFVDVTEDGKITGFLELDPDGHIDCAYIHPKFARRGIMTRLVEHALTA
jgi:ribosomal protein S18 acetylase RimI-like enzyme